MQEIIKVISAFKNNDEEWSENKVLEKVHTLFNRYFLYNGLLHRWRLLPSVLMFWPLTEPNL